MVFLRVLPRPQRDTPPVFRYNAQGRATFSGERKTTVRRRIRLLIACSLLALLFGCSKLTMENYEKLQMGLGYDEVVDILGKPDHCSEALFVRSCVWGDEQRNITVNFVGGKVVLFTSKNLK